jgi:ribose/xylose/arabinose/galactoside ABC-type transport system permease subunit
MNKRRFGTALYAIGGNEDAAKATGINVRKHKFSVYIINGILATTAGLILAARVGTTNPSIGVGLEFEGICGAVLGGTALAGGRGTVVGAFLGALAIAILKNGFNILGVLSFYQMVAIGSIIIIILVMDSVVAMRKEAQER